MAASILNYLQYTGYNISQIIVWSIWRRVSVIMGQSIWAWRNKTLQEYIGGIYYLSI